MYKTIGLLAHVDAGKTTFAEQLLYNTKSIKNLGRVDYKNSFMDNDDIEKERGITIFSDQAVFKYNGNIYNLIDTPGHADFSSEMERSLWIMDYAVLVISGVEGVESQTEVIWKLLRKHRIPSFIFINKMDRDISSLDKVLNDIKENLSEDVCYISDTFDGINMKNDIKEFIAYHDDGLFEKYIDGYGENNFWLDAMRRMIVENKIFPCMSGSALKNINIDYFIKNFDILTYTDYKNAGEFGGIVYKIRHDEMLNQITYIKALKGSLKVKDNLQTGCGEKRNVEKVNQIRIYNGNRFKTEDNAEAGSIFAVTGLENAKIGEGVGKINKKVKSEMVSTLKTKVIFEDTNNAKDILKYFRIIESEDPSLNVIFNDMLHEIEVHVMGTIQLEVLKQIMNERFNVKIDFGPCEILYKETILTESIGYGHFEPLRHYAEVHLKLEPGERNSDIVFFNECHTDDLEVQYQSLIRKHIYEREHHGILTGSPVTDIKITLLTGRANVKHTSGGDFREAAYRALRQGLEKSRNVLLEPYYKFRIETSDVYMGKVLSDIQKLSGTFEPPEITSRVVIYGRGPVSTFMNYAMEFASVTKGSGRINFTFDGYDLCHNEQEVIKKIGYDKNADIDYTSTSIFCSKGQSYLVKGCEAESYMHCLK